MRIKERSGFKAVMETKFRYPQRVNSWWLLKHGKNGQEQMMPLWTSPGLWWYLASLGFRGFSWSLRFPKHEDFCWALRVPPLTEMWCSAQSLETFSPLVPCYLGCRNATSPQNGKMFSSVTQIPGSNMHWRVRVRGNSVLPPPQRGYVLSFSLMKSVFPEDTNSGCSWIVLT